MVEEGRGEPPLDQAGHEEAWSRYRPGGLPYREGMRKAAAIPVLAVIVLTGCSGTTSPTTAASASGSSASRSSQPPGPGLSSTPPTSGRSASPAEPSKVLVVIEENHSVTQMRDQMPYLAGIANRYGYATHFRALAHPSEPNYLAIAGGSTFGVTDDGPPSENAPKVDGASSVLSRALRAGRSAATYAESMPQPCTLVDSYPYVVRHNPWTYFEADRADCRAHDLDTSTFASDAAHNRLPDVAFLIPNLVHDAHDGSLSSADAWLGTELAPVLNSRDFRSGSLVVVVTADEDDGSADNTVLTAVLHPRLHHVVVDTPLDHYALSRFVAEMAGVPPPGKARTAADLAAAFGL